MTITHLGAFLSGIGAVLSSWYALRSQRKRMDRECDRRIEEIRRAIHEGFSLGHK
jgi:hypothetical protein